MYRRPWGGVFFERLRALDIVLPPVWRPARAGDRRHALACAACLLPMTLRHGVRQRVNSDPVFGWGCMRRSLNASLAVWPRRFGPGGFGMCSGLCRHHPREVTFEDGALAAVSFIGGKEPAMRWMLRGPNGLSAYYEAHDLRAFDGQALRAEVHGILAGAGVKGAGRLADMIIRRLRR